MRFGDLQLVPVADGLLYVRPFYAAVPQSSDRDTTVTEYRFVIVSYDGRAAFGESLGEALAKLFPGFEGDLGDRVGADDEPDDRRRGDDAAGRRDEPTGHAGRAAGPGRPAARRRRRWRSTAGDLAEYQAERRGGRGARSTRRWRCSSRRRRLTA